MATSLTGIGILWAFLSLVSAIACCTGFYLPFWIKVGSTRVTHSFSPATLLQKSSAITWKITPAPLTTIFKIEVIYERLVLN